MSACWPPDELAISAIILAAGLSRRMGVPKMTLPWGETTVIGHVVDVLAQAGILDILVVTGGARQEVESALQNRTARCVFNPRYAEDQMLLSLQVGLSNLPAPVQACLVVLGDQPQIQASVVEEMLEVYRSTRAALVVPSYQMRRGHPWLIDRSLWESILTLPPQVTLRDVLKYYTAKIHYFLVDTDSVLRDLDTPADYERERPLSE